VRVGKSDARTRTLSLRAPITNEEERALFQRRLALAAMLIFVLAFGFWLAAFVGVLFVAPAHAVHFLTHPSSLIQLATCFSALAMAVMLRRIKVSVGALSTFDAAMFVAICFGWTFMIMFGSRGPRPEAIVLLASSYTLVARAAFIPSTPVRTALVGLVAFAPLIPVAALLDKTHIDPSVEPLPPAVYCGIWTAVGVAATTVISYVVHGLRLQVRKAMQLGQYVLDQKIGEGGMGVVYRASHALLRRPAAIKLLENVAEHSVVRFEREVQITARLTHPNTVAVFDYGRTPDGTFYYAMELLEGVTLEDLVTEHGPQPAPRVMHILLQACGALEEAHAAGLVHRDIKPANIMLTERGLLPDVVKVLDFGLVKEVDASANPSKTAVNSIMGTPHYMAPEAITDPDKIDARADLYALGATAYYLLTGERVFEGSNLIEVCSRHLHEAPVRPSKKKADVPPALEEIVLACLAKKKEERPADAGKLLAMLEAARREIGEWSRDEARDWWSKHSKKQKAASPQSVSAFGKTIAVALEDRGAA